MKTLVEQFKNREVKAKDIFAVEKIDKTSAYNFIKQYHYLGAAKFFSMYSFGLFARERELIGVATYFPPQGTMALKGWFNLPNSDTSVMELTRLCMLPEWNGTNATSYLLSHSMKMLKPYGIRAVITLADSTRHVGSIYQVCNFKYYGFCNAKDDFYSVDGKKNPRGKVSDKRGVWIPRHLKHRYAYLLDKTLTPLYPEQEKPKLDDLTQTICCHGTKVVTDTRYNDHYTCPVCTGKLITLTTSDWLDRLLD